MSRPKGRSRERAAWSASTALVAALVTFAAIPFAGAALPLPRKLDPRVLTAVSPRAIVVFDHDVQRDTIRRLARVGITHARVFDAIDAVAVLGPEAAYRQIATWDDVRMVDDDSPVSFLNHVAKIDTRVTDVREAAQPLLEGYSGEGVTIAVVDSGVDTTHPDLIDRIAANVNMEPSPLLDPITGGAYSEANSETPIGTDEFGHGTHVAGIVGGSGAAARGADLSGVAPNATLINCKMGLSLAFEVSALACYQWILDHRDDPRFPGGIRIATNSWEIAEDEGGDRPLELMVRKAVENQIAVVFSAGNSGEPAGDDKTAVGGYANRMEQVITVGATCKSEGSNPTICDPLEVANFSSRGPEVDVAAPGVDIWSSRATVSVLHAAGLVAGSQEVPGSPDPAATVVNRALYIGISGTSMAAPHVAGIVALMLEANPALTPPRIEKILISTALDFGDKGFDHDYGHGFVDALRAVSRAERSRPAGRVGVR